MNNSEIEDLYVLLQRWNVAMDTGRDLESGGIRVLHAGIRAMILEMANPLYAVVGASAIEFDAAALRLMLELSDAELREHIARLHQRLTN
jgi:hypothetical protein